MVDGEASDLTLRDILAAAAEGIDGVIATEAADSSWSAAGVTFAVLTGSTAEFRLDPLVARAALRTPDTAASPRGPEWVAFSPAVLDDPAVDRAEAWFLSAARLATSGSRRNR